MTPSTDFLLRRLRVRHLEMLVTLLETGTLRAAAQRLHLSQPALSKMLSEVEAAFGSRLFERSPQGLTANPSGLAAAYRARVVLAELSRARDEVDALVNGAHGILRIGTLSVTASVPRAVVRLRRQWPQARVQIQEGRVGEMIKRLLDGELDCVFGAITPELLTSDLLGLLEPEIVLQDKLCVLCRDDHPMAGKRRVAWADLRVYPWVAPPKDTLVRQALMTAFLNGGLEPPEPAIEVLSSVTIGSVLRMEASLLGATRLEHAADELARGGVRRLPLLPEVPIASQGLYTRRGMETPALVKAFTDALRFVAGKGKNHV